MPRRLPLLLAVLLLAGCGDDEIRVYRVPKRADLAPRPAPTSSFRWEAPAGWQEVAPTGDQLARFRLPGEAGPADCTLSLLAGDGGGALNNANRWRAQMGLAPIDEQQLLDGVQMVRMAGAPGFVLSLRGSYTPMGGAPQPGSQMVGAMSLTAHGSLFLKLVGPEATVTEHVEDFVRFLASVHDTHDHGHAAHTPSASPPPPTSNLQWSRPAGWETEAAGGMRLASFRIPGAAGEADASIVVLAGDGGGVAENVNRWREQMGLARLPDDALLAELANLEVAGGSGWLVSLRGDYTGMGEQVRAGYALLGAVGISEDGALFVKLVGPAATVTEQRDAFLALVRSLRFE